VKTPRPPAVAPSGPPASSLPVGTRRSGCLTNAEWIVDRFGEGRAARRMRLITAAMCKPDLSI
jgi:hypothetical protein